MQGKLRSALVPVLGVFLITGSALGQTAAPQPKPSTSPAPKAQKRSAPPNRVVPAPPALEPRAIDILKAMSEKLAAAHTLTFTAVEIFEHSSRQGNPLAYSTRYEVTLQRPDKLKVVIPGDGPASEFYYNGKTMTAYAPVENMAAVAPAPPTIDKMLEQAYKTAAIYYPFADLIVADPYKDMASDIKLAYYIGQSHVLGGGTTDMVAYIVNGVFIQVWIDTDDKMPRLYARSIPRRPRTAAPRTGHDGLEDRSLPAGRCIHLSKGSRCQAHYLCSSPAARLYTVVQPARRR